MRTHTITTIIFAAGLLFNSSAHAVVVAGANGGGSSNNTSQASLESAIGGSFIPYENVVKFSTSTGIYLGYDDGTKDIWVLSAKHVADSSADITIDGTSYAFQSRTNLSVDIELNRYKHVSGVTPTLPTVSFASIAPTALTNVVMIGAGRTRNEASATNAFISDATSTGGATSGYHWTGSKLKRWGTNETSLSPTYVAEGWTGGNNVETHSTFGEMFFTTFDTPTAGEWLTSNEAGVANGDSGGGVFVLEGGEWKLAGINSLLFTENLQNANTTAFGNQASHINLANYQDEISAVTGTLVPEPSSLLFITIGTFTLLRRRR